MKELEYIKESIENKYMGYCDEVKVYFEVHKFTTTINVVLYGDTSKFVELEVNNDNIDYADVINKINERLVRR